MIWKANDVSVPVFGSVFHLAQTLLYRIRIKMEPNEALIPQNCRRSSKDMIQKRRNDTVSGAGLLFISVSQPRRVEIKADMEMS